MVPPDDILDLIRRARSGDELASAELARMIEPLIQRVVRRRLGKPGRRGPLNREFGSSDVCQSVFRSLFKGIKENRYRFERPNDLERLLQVMVRFNVAAKARRSSVRLRKLFDEFEGEGWVDTDPEPDEVASEKELAEAIRAQFTDDELEILTLWLDDRPWSEIAVELGGTADSVRVRLRRAIVRVRQKMNGPKTKVV